jgi:hypothetical protein
MQAPLPSGVPVPMGLPVAPEEPPGASSAAAELHEGWEEQIDAASGRSYYIHGPTGDVVLDRPLAASPPPLATAPVSQPSITRTAVTPNPGYSAQQPAPDSARAPDSVRGSSSARPADSVRGSISESLLRITPIASQLGTVVREAVFGAAAAPAAVAATRPSRQLASTTIRQEGALWTLELQPTRHPERTAATIGTYSTEAAALAAARHDAPPVWLDAEQCTRCAHGFGLFRRRTHCRNCGYSFCKACCKKVWPRASMPRLYSRAADGEMPTRVCAGCDEAANALRTALLAGDVTAARRVYEGGRGNVNLGCHLPPTSEGARALLLPVHLAAASGSLPMVRWLAEEEYCAVVGERALSVGAPPKSVMRVAIEARAIDVLQWLVAADDAPAHTGVPAPMPLDSGCAAAAVHRALEAALKEGYRQRGLTQATLEAVALSSSAAEARPQAAPMPPAEAELPEGSECVVCLAAPRECVLLECGHACVCEQCSATLVTCPLCRANIERVVRMFQ